MKYVVRFKRDPYNADVIEAKSPFRALVAYLEARNLPVSQCLDLLDIRAVAEHVHVWGPSFEDGVQWCKECDATRDQDGGIIY